MRTNTASRASMNEFAQDSLASKLEYLQTENAQLSDQVHELGNLLTLNRQALRLMNQSNKVSEDDKDSDRTNSRGLLMVIKNMQEENENLQRQVDRLIMERNQAQNQVLINQQIMEAAQRHEKEFIIDLEQRIQSLNKQLKTKESQILQLEQTKPSYDEMAGIVIKYRDIITPDKAIMKLHDEIEMLNERIVQDQRRIEQSKKEKIDIQNLNFKLTSELLRLKSTAMTHHGKNLILSNSKPEGLTSLKGLVKFQSEMLKAVESSPESSDNDGSLVMSPLPMKNENAPGKGLVLPKLDLTRAKQIQEINAKRQIQQMQEKQNKCVEFQVLEKIQKLEKVVDDVRKNLQREMLLNRTFVIENDELKRLTEELEHRNQLMAKSNIHYEENWRRINKQYQYLQQFYIQNKDQIASQQTQTQTHSHNRLAPQTPTKQFERMRQESDNSFRMADLERQVDDSYFKNIDFEEELNEGDGQMKKKLQNQYYAEVVKIDHSSNPMSSSQTCTINDSKKFLLGMAQNMYMVLQDKLEAIKNLPADQPITRIQRSMSDIVDYQRQGLQQFVYQKPIIQQIPLPESSSPQAD